MEEVAATIRDWLEGGRRVAFGRVVDVQGFGGSSQVELFAMDDLGTIAGGLLAGTIDNVVIPAAREILAGPTHAGLRLVVGEVHGDAVQQAGLACGGSATVLVQSADGVPRQFWEAVADQTPVALASVIDGPSAAPRALAIGPEEVVWGSLGDADTEAAVTATARALLAEGIGAIRRQDSELGTVLIEALIPPPRVVAVGNGTLADAIVFQASILGWQGRIAGDIQAADEALSWAGPSGAVVVLSHLASLDAPALAAAISHRAFYLGALGSRRTQAARTNRLRELGVAVDDIGRIRGPVGLDLGGQTPALIALAICAEILAVRTGRDGTPLRHREAPIRPQTVGRQLRR